jgi:hypothetical protein
MMQGNSIQDFHKNPMVFKRLLWASRERKFDKTLTFAQILG